MVSFRLFGSEDVDFRKMTRPALNPGDCLPSPPPPPVISNGPQGPQVATIAPLMIVDSNKTNPGENTCSEFSRENQMSDNQLLGNRGREGFDVSRGRYRKNWNDSKLKSETEIKPLILSSQLELELDPRKVFILFNILTETFLLPNDLLFENNFFAITF